MGGTDTLSLKEQIVECSIALDAARLSMSAERDWRSVHGNGGPWSGSAQKFDELSAKLAELRVQERGHALNDAVARLREIRRDIDEAQKQRDLADRNLATLRLEPVVEKWLASGSFARQMGWGYSWAAQWQPFYLSGKPVSPNMPSCATQFLAPNCPEQLRFNMEKERATIIAYNSARGESEKWLIIWTSHTQRHAALLRERPELQSLTGNL